MELPIEFNSSVVKRVNMDWETFVDAVERSGFSQTGSAGGGRILYHENDAGFAVTLINGPRANLILPSGPIRGRLFGNSGFSLGSEESRLENLAQDVRSPTEGSSGSSSGSRGRTGREVNA